MAMREFKFQEEWARGSGLLLIAAIYIGGIGGGAYLVSAGFDYLPGIIIGFLLLAVGKSAFHLAFLGKPERFWRIILNPRTSWISRGIWALGIFTILGLAVLGSAALPIPGTMYEPLRIASMLVAAFLIIYDGFVLASCRGVPFGNNSILVALFPAAALAAGSAITYLAFVYAGDTPPGVIEKLELTLIVIVVFFIVSYLWTASYVDVGAVRSVTALVRKEVKLAFLAGTLGFGVGVPVLIIVLSISIHSFSALLPFSAFSALLGDFFLKYSLLRAGIYRSLVYPPGISA